MVVIGIDADTRRVAWHVVAATGLSVGPSEIDRTTPRGHLIADYASRLVSLMREAQDIGAVVYLEGTYLASSFSKRGESANVRTFQSLCEVQGEVKYEARRHGVPVVIVGAGEWRGPILGAVHDRKSLKLRARERAERDTGRTDLTEHECDAVCIAQYGAMREKGV